MRSNEYRKLSKHEAFAEIGLHPKDNTTYFLLNLIIEIKKDTLRITKISGKNSFEPQDTFETAEPFIFVHSGIEYLLIAENGNLSVYEKEHFISR